MKQILVFLFVLLTFSMTIKGQTKTDNGNLVISEANNTFAITFYSKIKKESNKNIFFSPFSIMLAFSMAYEGAAGNTANEIQSVFYLPSDREKISKTIKLFLKTFLNIPDIGSDKIRCKIIAANAYWVQKDFQILKKYASTIEEKYAAEAYNVDFISNAQAAMDTINNWVNNKTQGKIQKILDEGDVNTYTRLVLTNAIYFKAPWLTKFDKNNTREDDFKVDENTTVKVKMMQLKNKEFPYAETKDLQIIKIPYECGNLSMLIWLPKTVGLENLESIINTDRLILWEKLLTKQKVDVYLPRFKILTAYDLSNPLKELGIRDAFDKKKADFSNITGSKNLYISKAIHKAFVEVNEEGTEAAATTGIGFSITSMRPDMNKVFRADHPFLFFIIEENSKVILFAGRIVKP